LKNLIRVALATTALVACTTPPGPDAGRSVTNSQSQAGDFEQDRASILAMAGVFKVKFDFIETVALAEGYELKDRKLSGAYEVVKVIEDEGDYISLQHVLYVGGERKFPLKHWRQDWQYEPTKVLTFIGGNAWTTTDVSSADRRGAWSQEVYQVDDSPRYGGVGRWNYDNGIAAWEPARAWRPLPRRDMTTRDDYHAVDAINRHAITPDGWVHEQDNTKVVLSTDEPAALVREIAVNTYQHTDEVTSDVVDASWDATKDYWEAVRESWENLEDAREPFALTLKGEPQDLYMALLGYASEVESGGMTMDEAIAEARETISTYTTTDLAPLVDRLR